MMSQASLTKNSYTTTNKREREYLEVSHHDEASGADPRRREASRVEDAVLMLLDHVGVTQQANQHH